MQPEDLLDYEQLKSQYAEEFRQQTKRERELALESKAIEAVASKLILPAIDVRNSRDNWRLVAVVSMVVAALVTVLHIL